MATTRQSRRNCQRTINYSESTSDTEYNSEYESDMDYQADEELDELAQEELTIRNHQPRAAEESDSDYELDAGEDSDSEEVVDDASEIIQRPRKQTASSPSKSRRDTKQTFSPAKSRRSTRRTPSPTKSRRPARKDSVFSSDLPAPKPFVTKPPRVRKARARAKPDPEDIPWIPLISPLYPPPPANTHIHPLAWQPYRAQLRAHYSQGSGRVAVQPWISIMDLTGFAGGRTPMRSTMETLREEESWAEEDDEEDGDYEPGGGEVVYE